MKFNKGAEKCILKLLDNNEKLILPSDKVKTSKDGLPSELKEDYRGIEGVVEGLYDTDSSDDVRESIHCYVNVFDGKPLMLSYGWLELIEESEESKAMKVRIIEEYKSS